MATAACDNKYVALNCRLGIKTPKLHFDPLVTEIQRRAKEKNVTEAKRKSSDEKDEFFTDGGKLNMLVTFEELEAWNLKHDRDGVTHYHTQMELEYDNKDGEGSMSFKEYLPHFSYQGIEKNKTGHGDAGWWKVQFTKSDVDRNENLSFSEFMERMDCSGEVKLDIHEFQNNVYDIYKSYIKFETWSPAPKPENKFDELDVNKDNIGSRRAPSYLPLYLNPGEISYAEYFIRHLIREANDNKDGKLSLEEMFNHEESFYGSLFEEEDDDGLHDEL